MKGTNEIKNIRNFIDNGLRIKLTPGNPDNVRAAAFAFHNAVSQIPDEAILFLMKNPNARLRTHKIKPSNVLHNANKQTKRRRRDT